MTYIPGHSIWDLVDAPALETLFINRDGTILKRTASGGVPATWEEAEFQPCFLAKIKDLSDRFRHIIVLHSVRPEDGSSPKQQAEINAAISEAAAGAGGRIDTFYTEWHDTGSDRTASLRLPLQARRDYPDIDFSRALMVGDTDADRLLAFNCGMEFLTLNTEIDPAKLVDFGEVDAELNLLRREMMANVEMINKMMNSTRRIRAIRLAASSCSSAMLSGHRVIVACADDSGIDSNMLLQDLERVASAVGSAAHVVALKQRGEESLADQMSRVASTHDVAICLSAGGNSPELNGCIEAAQAKGCITVSLTGAKPSAMDSADVVIKVPSTNVTHIQGAFKLIMGILHGLVSRQRKG